MPELSNDYRVVIFGAGGKMSNNREFDWYWIRTHSQFWTVQKSVKVYFLFLVGVGKTSLVHRFIKGTFNDSYTPTIEDTYKWVPINLRRWCDASSLYFRKVISSNNAVCTMQITDTAGSHQFPAMQRLSISKGDDGEKRNVSSFYLNVLFPRPRVHYGVLNILSAEFGGAEACAGANQRGKKSF